MAIFNLHNDIDNQNNFMSNLIEKVSAVPDNENIEINISSFGGDTMLGMPLGEALLRHKGPVKMVVDGMCGSMAAFLTTYCDDVVATEGASFMFHKARSDNETTDPGTLKIVSIINTNFKNRMQERGIDAELIKDVFERDQERYLSAFEAKEKGIIKNVVKNERKNNSPFERIVAKLNSIMIGKKKEEKKEKKIVFIALMDDDGQKLLTAFETPDGVIEEGTQLMPLNGQEIKAGIYSFEGSRITVDATGKVTAIEQIEEEEIEAKKHEDDEDKKMSAEAIDKKIEAAIEKSNKDILAKIEGLLAKVGTKTSIKASFEDQLKKPEVITPKILARRAELALKARVNKTTVK